MSRAAALYVVLPACCCCHCSGCNLVCMHSRLAKSDWLLNVAIALGYAACCAALTPGQASIFELGLGCRLESSGRVPSTARGSRCFRARHALPQSLGVASQLRGGSTQNTGDVKVVQGETYWSCTQQVRTTNVPLRLHTTMLPVEM